MSVFFIHQKIETVPKPTAKILYQEFDSGVLGEELNPQVDLSPRRTFINFCLNCNGLHSLKRCPFPKNELKIREKKAALKKRQPRYFHCETLECLDDEAHSPQKQNQMTAFNMGIEDIINGINSHDERKEFIATHAARKVFGSTCNPAQINKLLKSGVVSKLVKFLGRVGSMDLQSESALALHNLTSFTPNHIKAVVSAGAVAALIAVLFEQTYPNGYIPLTRHYQSIEPALLALTNIAEEGVESRDVVIGQGIINSLLSLLRNGSSTQCLRDIAKLCCSLSRNLSNIVAVGQLLPALCQLLNEEETHILSETCRALSRLTDGHRVRIQQVMDAGILGRLILLLDHVEEAVVLPVLRTVGNIVRGSVSQTNSVLAAGACPLLIKLLAHCNLRIVKMAAWTLSIIAAGNTVQIQTLITNNVICPLLDVFEDGILKVQKQVAWAITNIIMGMALPYPKVDEHAILSLCQLAGNGPDRRERFIEHGIVKPLINYMKDDSSVELMRNATWIIFCLCRKDFKLNAIQQILPTLALLLDCNDPEILVNICTTFTYLKDAQGIQSVVDAGILPKLVALLDRKEVEVLTPLLEIIQNFVCSSKTIQDYVLASGAKELLVKLVNNSHF